MTEPREEEKGWRPLCCDKGRSKACCTENCAADEERAELRTAAGLLPVAYAIYGINARGEHYIEDVKLIKPGAEWTTDSHYLGCHWAGNVGLILQKDKP